MWFSKASHQTARNNELSYFADSTVQRSVLNGCGYGCYSECGFLSQIWIQNSWQLWYMPNNLVIVNYSHSILVLILGSKLPDGHEII